MKFLNKNLHGFTLIEVIVTLAILAILMGITYSSYPRLSSVIAFNASVQEFVATFKAAQLYGSSSGGDSRGSGIYIDTSNPEFIREFNDNVIPNNYSDTGVLLSNKYYDNNVGNDTELTKLTQIKNSVAINKILVDGANKTKVSITYIRPNTEAWIKDITEADPSIFYTKASIELRSKTLGDDYLTCVTIYKNGQVDLKNSPCTN
jgi:prepilin-type N-terminal cleavage/methylation domain-containing protein